MNANGKGLINEASAFCTYIMNDKDHQRNYIMNDCGSNMLEQIGNIQNVCIVSNVNFCAYACKTFK